MKFSVWIPNGRTAGRGRMRRRKRRLGPFDCILLALLLLFSAVLMIVLIWSAITSLTNGNAYELEGMKYGFPVEYFTFENYKTAYLHLKITLYSAAGSVEVYTPQLFLNSLVYAAGSALLISFVTCTVAYLTSKYPFKPSKIIYNVVLIVMIVPIVGELPSMTQMLTRVGLYDNLFGLLLMRASFTNMYFLVFYAYFKGIPWSYGESAFIDGAGHLRVYLRIVMPLAKSIFLTVFLLNFIVFWNEYQIPMVLLPSMPTIAQGVYSVRLSFDSALAYTPSKIAVGVLACIPILVIFCAFNKRLMGNLSVGGLKG